MAIYNSVLDTIGHTPLVRLNKVTEGLHAEVVVPTVIAPGAGKGFQPNQAGDWPKP